MIKKVLALILVFALSISLFPLNEIIIGVKAQADITSLQSDIISARPLLYKGYSEQSRKYLADRIERAEALVYSPDYSESDIAAARSELKNAVNSLVVMNAYENVAINGFDVWKDIDLSTLSESAGDLSFDEISKPDQASFSIKVTAGEKGATLSNGAPAGIVAASPFGADMLKADGIKLWISVEKSTSFNITIGVKGVNTISFIATDVAVAETVETEAE